MKPVIMSLAGAVAISFIPPNAEAKTAKCEIVDGTDHSAGRYVGPCEFTANKGGSFEIVLPRSAEGKVISSYIVVDIISNGRARLSGSVWGRGQVSDWGAVNRDPRRPACWSGQWGRVCAF